MQIFKRAIATQSVNKVIHFAGVRLLKQSFDLLPGGGLGQYNLKALSDKNVAGIGLTLGICVAFIGLIFDNLIRTWVEKRKKHLGIA